MPDVKVVHRKDVGNLRALFQRAAVESYVKVSLTERRSSFTFARSRCFGAASKRILPDLSALSEYQCGNLFWRGHVLLLMGTAPAKIMKLIAREAAGSA